MSVERISPSPAGQGRHRGFAERRHWLAQQCLVGEPNRATRVAGVIPRLDHLPLPTMALIMKVMWHETIWPRGKTASGRSAFPGRCCTLVCGSARMD